ncbi:right-handed parallel beta-helix repeat-containing protein [Zobellia galactanivorans]|uniref:right-handed parallel beta-helix repeat-containing protein n=1 Tax=Zobellia galactanivorans (strain DSM 12802 / CCUG 47099 / CIP 106680 / NCIMB 13871 / Dsij) TaxID=63186 RepID=UPI001C064D77|nr:right-handed parallel beta-helix repeat-containing protein [Zobellia galactanivorans]MBU3027569.1 right-handed parallel beta-helix repeat-containing protein [Zobellia galactanivorans]
MVPIKQRRKAYVLYAFLMLCATTAFAQNNYYLSASGNDSNSGTSEASPWKTINKLNSVKNSIKPGDVIHFNRGDVFYGSLDLKGKKGSSGKTIVLKSYGSGDKAIIRASVKINNWTRHSGNIWKANLAKVDNGRTPALFLNNVAQQIGREPNVDAANGGYRRIKSHAGNNKSISEGANLPYASNRFQGGEITIRTTDDNVKVETVTSHSGNTVNFGLSDPSATFENAIENNFGYFFQNHVNTLDKNGEWAHDTNAGVLYLYSNTNPNSLSVEIPSGESALSLNNTDYVKVQDLRLEGGLKYTLAISGASNMTLTNCHIYNGNEYLSLGYTLTNITATNNTFEQSNNIAIRWEGLSGLTFANNKIINIGMRSGMGARSFIGYTGARFVSRSGSSANVIEKNTLKNIGYHAMLFSGGNLKIRYNDISNYCYTKDDGGGIYSVGNRNSNNSVYGNIVHDSPGAIRGIPEGRGVKTAGIYIDNDSQNQLIYENTVYNIVGWGLMANLSSKSTIRDNTVYNCEFGLVLSTYNNSFGAGGSTAKATDNTVVDNIFFSKKPSQVSARYTNQITDAGFNTFLGDINSNYYCMPYNGSKQISVTLARKTDEYTLDEFRTKYPNYENKGKSAPVKFGASVDPNTFIKFVVNNTGTAKAVNLGSENYVDAKHKNYSGSVTVPAYSSIVLLKGSGNDGSTEEPQLIENGTYTIGSVTSNQRLLSRALENYNARMVNPGDYADQKWVFNHLGNNVYTIKSKANGRFLEVPYAKCQNSVQVSTYTSAAQDHQKWKVVENGNAIYGLKPNHCLEQGLDRNNGTLDTNVITYSYGADNGNQKWKILPIAASLNVDEVAIKAYPNPSTEFIKVAGIKVGDRLKIRNMSGVVIKEIHVKSLEETIPLDDIKSGVYIISVSDKESIQFLKQ